MLLASRDEDDRRIRCFRGRLVCVLLLLQMICTVNGDNDQEKKFYIVYLGDSPVLKDSIVDSHINILSDVVGSELAAKDSIVHSYVNNFNAFAAKLSPEEAKRLESSRGVVSVFPNQQRKLHTTKTWDFLGFPHNVKRKVKLESNLVVGLIDTGITPGSESFNDKGFGPPPAKWKGSCGPYANFSCNNKIVGGRYFKLDKEHDELDDLSPLDVQGHGTHTSSTVLGNVVNGANLLGLGKGAARGAVPAARVAMYKVCWASSGCQDMDLLAAFDAAIEDGVDVISISIGGQSENYFKDPIAIGAFHAMKKGIITVASAGNEGPDLASVVNHAPWILTVAASGIDREYRSKVTLGNGKSFYGIGINAVSPKRKMNPLISGADAGFNKSDDPSESSYCSDDSLDPKKVKGKVVLCELQSWGVDSVVAKAGGTGTLLDSSQNPDTAQIFMASGTVINETLTKMVKNYIKSTRSPSAVIYKTQEMKVKAPFVASFSSRGPNSGSRRLLKPDITAPGIDILAAFTPLRSISGIEGDTKHSKFNIMSGTSMSCPHVAGVAAYVKSFHPAWSPSAIKSAILTTATHMRPDVNAELAYGAGQVNPKQAVHPGLIYDMNQLPYIQFLCQEGYKDDGIRIIVGSKSVNCSELPPPSGHDALNYPTMQVTMKTTDKKPVAAVFKRTVTNVGPAKSIYNATIVSPKEVDITVKPMSLVFTKRFQKISFTVTVKGKRVSPDQELLSGSLTWKSNIHSVRSPILLFTSDYF
ncbi:hypothetical protein C5167_048215 [Papaver somniferum]|uniref:Subtilisin-like protease SBT4.14 n=1 Tax=Papaver somniferum TaxID=3469 RepID=A0A4Y7KLH7_PAPSO|nr:subtilisin-like protease SBT4.14 [Papaver somniferum]RZC72735.1 hypothetical protein C5167_048215 [Papaver somniferum]